MFKYLSDYFYNLYRDDMKTSDEWYKLDKTRDIIDPDGWRKMPRPADYWNNVRIIKEEYEDRAYKCSVGPYNYRDHKSPFSMC